MHVPMRVYSLVVFFTVPYVRRFDANCFSEIAAVCIEQQHRIQTIDKLFEKIEDTNSFVFTRACNETATMQVAVSPFLACAGNLRGISSHERIYVRSS